MSTNEVIPMPTWDEMTPLEREEEVTGKLKRARYVKYCTNCGLELSSERRKCPKCGSNQLNWRPG